MGEAINPMEWKIPNRNKMLVEKREGEAPKERLIRLIKAVKYIRVSEGYRHAHLLHSQLDEIEELLINFDIDQFDITRCELEELRWDAFRRDMESHASVIDRSSIKGQKDKQEPTKLDQIKSIKEVITKLENWLAKSHQELE
jgi:hypothetical protein